MASNLIFTYIYEQRYYVMMSVGYNMWTQIGKEYLYNSYGICLNLLHDFLTVGDCVFVSSKCLYNFYSMTGVKEYMIIHVPQIYNTISFEDLNPWSVHNNLNSGVSFKSLDIVVDRSQHITFHSWLSMLWFLVTSHIL